MNKLQANWPRSRISTSEIGALPRAGRADIDLLATNTIRTLAMNAVQKADSGHPGTPIGLAQVAFTFWQSFLRYDPKQPSRPNRDGFVLSNGHASMLLYALPHLAGVHDAHAPDKAVALDAIMGFRQLDSDCPGHPEHGLDHQPSQVRPKK